MRVHENELGLADVSADDHQVSPHFGRLKHTKDMEHALPGAY
jgi:hypothetical protein